MRDMAAVLSQPRTVPRTEQPWDAGRCPPQAYALVRRGWARPEDDGMRRLAARSGSEAAVSLLVAPDGAQEVDLAEGRPVDVAEVKLAVGALPQQEARQPDLAGGPDDQVGIGEIRGVEVPADLL